MQTQSDIADWLDEHELRFTRMADEIWDNPELQFVEFKASKLQADFLEAEGFSITWDLGGCSTAFAAEWGAGRPVIAFAGEYDALPGLVTEGPKHARSDIRRRRGPRLRAQSARHWLFSSRRRVQKVARTNRPQRHRPLLRLSSRRRWQRQSIYGPRRRLR